MGRDIAAEVALMREAVEEIRHDAGLYDDRDYEFHHAVADILEHRANVHEQSTALGARGLRPDDPAIRAARAWLDQPAATERASP